MEINEKRKKYPLTLGQLHKQGRTERIKDFDLLESCHRDWFQSSKSHFRSCPAITGTLEQNIYFTDSNNRRSILIFEVSIKFCDASL